MEKANINLKRGLRAALLEYREGKFGAPYVLVHPEYTRVAGYVTILRRVLTKDPRNTAVGAFFRDPVAVWLFDPEEILDPNVRRDCYMNYPSIDMTKVIDEQDPAVPSNQEELPLTDKLYERII